MSQTTTRFYTVTRDAWTAMLEDIKGAEKTIDIEQYIFTADAAGMPFIEALQEKAKAGVKVRMICDMAGSLSFYRSLIPDMLKNIGIEVRFYNPISVWRLANFSSNLFRDHRKILVVDRNIAHVGGVGVQDYMGPWRDTHMAFCGDIARDVAENFDEMWNGMEKTRFVRFKRPERIVREYGLLTNSPGFGQRRIFHALVNQINNAKKYVYLTTPYFIPDIAFYRAMRKAAKRGVDVRLLVPKMADHFFINHARESYFTLALKSKIRIYNYTPYMMHAKTAVIDDEWATAGSFNLDSLSFNLNHEANIFSTNPDFVAEIKKHFITDLEKCEEVKYADWIKRPWFKKFLELLTWPFHALM